MLTEEQKRFLSEQDQRMSENMSKIKHRIVVFSGKGGVGKTFVSVNLAYGLSRLGYKTGILDADVTGPNVIKMTGMTKELHAIDERLIPDQRNGLNIISVAHMLPSNVPVMWRGPMRSKLLCQFLGDVEWGSLDYLIADLPPGTGDEIITLSDKMKPDLAIIITTPQEISLIDSGRSINMAKELKLPKIGVIENMSGLLCPGCGCNIDLFGSGGGQRQAREMKVEFLGSIPIDIEARKMADEGMPVILENPESIVSREINNIAGKIIEIAG
jgi:ATP-binding protein involved in chromosome partitioning